MKLPRPILAFLLLVTGMWAQENWQPRVSGTTVNLWGIAYGNGLWVAVGDPGTILTSPNGITWTKRDSGFPTRWLVSVAYANGLFVVTGGTPPQTERQGIILTSPDGVTWTPRVNNATRINNVAWGNGTWLAVDDLGGRWTSLDGLTWSFGTTARTGYLRGLAYGAPTFVSTGLTGIQSSYDGIGWVNRVPGAGQIEGLAYGRGRFVAVGTLGLAGVTYSSRDGANWTQQPTTTDLSARAVTFFNNQFILTGTATVAGGGLATSFDGVGWTPRPTGLPANSILLAVAAGPDSAIAVGTEGAILQSAAALSAPSIATQPSPVLEAMGGNVAFAVSARGSLPLAYQWRKDGLVIDGATAETLFLPSVQIAHSGNYSCIVTNAAGAAASSAAALNVVATFPAADPVDAGFNLGAPLNVAPRTLAAQPDGKLLLGGSFLLLNQGQPQFGLARLNADGSLDTSFKPGALDPNGAVTALAVQPDGRILAGGSFTSINGAARPRLARLNADGSVDPSFNWPAPAGAADPRFFVQPDGRIIVHDGSTTLARLRPDGSADPTWTRTPITTGINGTATSYGTPQACDFQSDGKIIVVVSGAGSPPGNITTLNLVRLNSDGTLDATFAPIALGLNATIRALRVLSDDRIQVVVFGTGGILQRFSPAGLFDGSAALTFNGGSVTAVAITSGGETWFSGSFVSLNGLGRSQLARLNNDGSVDATYNPGSGLTTAAGSATVANLILPLTDGRAVVVGDFARVNGLARAQIARLNAQSLGGANAPVFLPTGSLYRELAAGAPLPIPLVAVGSAQLSLGYASPFGGTGALNPPSPEIAAGIVTQTGVYTVTVSNSSGASTSQPLFVRIVPSPPFFIQQPAPLQTNTGRVITLTTTVGGTSGMNFQWFKNNAAVSGAVSQNFIVARATAADTGDYTVVARNALGFASSVTAHVGVDETMRFINLATRGNAGRADSPLIVGFVASGPGNKRVMVRAVGPTLAGFGVAGTLPDPVLRVFNSSGTQIFANDDWGQTNDVPGIASANARLGAFPLDGGSADAAGILTLAPGAYTVVINGKVVDGTEATGIALAEIYEDDSASSRLVNLSSRGFVSPGASVMIPAFVSAGTGTAVTKKFLIRGVGPTLAGFGVTGALANPTLNVVDSAGRTVAANDDWETNVNLAELRAATTQFAFPLAPGSRDAALLLSLPAGAYTCVVSGVNNTSGTALVEVYEVP